MKKITVIMFGVVVLMSTNAFADDWSDDELKTITMPLIPIVLFTAVFTFLTLRHYFESRVQSRD